jgi:hypothetical protein
MRQIIKRVLFSESCNEVCATEAWYKRWNIKINKDKTQAIYFSPRLRPPEAHLTLSRQNVPFVKHVKYLGVIFDERITQRLHTEMT